MAFGSMATKSVDDGDRCSLTGCAARRGNDADRPVQSHITDQLLRIRLNYKLDPMDLDKVLMIPNDRIAPR